MEKEEKKISRTLFKILCIFIILLVIIFLYGRYINTKGLKVNEIAIYNESLNSDYNGLKIAQFSDIHYGRTTTEEDLENVINKLNELNADIIIFTGDLFDNKNIKEEDKEQMINYLSKINAKLFKFAIIGDYDEKYLNTYTNILEESNFILLDNSSKLVYYNSSTPINFIGITSTNDIEELYNNDYFNITLIHKPDLIKDINNSQITFAGHSLGGQIRIPFIGGIKKINGAKTYIDKHYQTSNTDLYISNGIGTQDISFRIFNKPSITLYRLYQS